MESSVSSPSRYGFLTSSAPFPPLAWAGSVLVLVSIPGLAELFSGGTAPLLVDLIYDAAILAAVNAPALVWILRVLPLPYLLRVVAALGLVVLAVLLLLGLPTAEHYGAWGFPVVPGLLILALVCATPSGREASGEGRSTRRRDRSQDPQSAPTV